MAATNKVFAVARKDIKEAFSSKSTYIYVIFLLAFMLPYYGILKDIFGSLSKRGASMADLLLPGQTLSNIAFYTFPLVLAMLICSIFSAYSIIMDKTKRTLESLLATSVSLRQIWLGKTLAVAVPSIVLSLLLSILALVACNLIIVVPAIGRFIVPDSLSLAIGLVIIPVMTFLIVLVVNFFQLTMTNPRIANLIFPGIFIGIFISTVISLGKSYDFAPTYLKITLIVIGILIAVNLLLSRFLTKDRVILSSKG